MSQTAAIDVTPASARADVITCAIETGMPAALDQLAAAAAPGHRFLRRAWYSGQADAGTCTLLAKRRDGSPVIAMPTRAIGPTVMRARTVVGSYWPYRSFPIAHDATDAELRTFLECPIVQRALGPALRIGPIYAEDPSALRLCRVAKAMGWQVLVRQLGYSFIQDIAGQAMAAGRWPSKSRQRKVRAYERKLEEAHGPLSIRWVRGGEWTDDVFDHLAAIERASWVGSTTDHSGAKFINERQRRHWRHAVRDPLLARMISATLLYAADRPIAFSLDLTVGDLQYAIASSYVEAMAAFSPGQIVTVRHLEHCLAHGVRTIDWGSGDSGYKQEMGAKRGPAIHDLLLVRGAVLAAAIRPRWEMSTDSVSMALAAGLAGSLGAFGRSGAVRMEHLMLPSLALAAAAMAITE